VLIVIGHGNPGLLTEELLHVSPAFVALTRRRRRVV
jgi:hypothetical protein